MLRAEEAYEGYERAWTEPGRAAALLEKVLAPEGVYADDDVPDGVIGPAALAALMVETHEALPGFPGLGDERPTDACGAHGDHLGGGRRRPADPASRHRCHRVRP